MIKGVCNTPLHYWQGIAGQARNNGEKDAMTITVNAMSENKNDTIFFIKKILFVCEKQKG